MRSMMALTCVFACAVVRDFQPYGSANLNGLGANPDFENCIAAEKGIVATTLGADGKPVYAKTREPLKPCLSWHTPSCLGMLVARIFAQYNSVS